MAKKKKRKKGEIKDQLELCLEEIVNCVNEAVDLSFGKKDIKSRAALAVLLYDINRASAQALALLRSFGLDIKMDLDFMAAYKDDPFCDSVDFQSHIKLKTVDLEEKK